MAGSSYGLLNWKLRKSLYVGFFYFLTAKQVKLIKSTFFFSHIEDYFKFAS